MAYQLSLEDTAISACCMPEKHRLFTLMSFSICHLKSKLPPYSKMVSINVHETHVMHVLDSKNSTYNTTPIILQVCCSYNFFYNGRMFSLQLGKCSERSYLLA